MAIQPIYVVMVRGRGLFLVEPIPGEGQGEAVEKSLGLKGGYSSGLVYIDVPEGVDEAWVAVVACAAPGGEESYEYRAYHPDLSEEQVIETADKAGETVVRLNRSHIYRERDRNAAPEPEGPPVEWPG